MSKSEWRRGPHIMSIDEVVRQEMIFWKNSLYSKRGFTSWKVQTIADNVGKDGCIFYAMPAGVTTRFSDEDVIRAEHRMHTDPTLDDRKWLISIINSFDRGNGDVDDAIDAYEDDPGY